MLALDPAKSPRSLAAREPTLMPHRLEYLVSLKLAVGTVGTAASSWALLHLASVDPDHLKLAMVAIGGACIYLIRMAMKDVATFWVPSYASSRKQLLQMDLDMRDMERKFEESEARSGAAIVEVKEEALAKAGEVEREASKRRHDLADRIGGELALVNIQLLEANAEIARLKAQVGATATTHARVINTVSDSVAEVAERVVPPVEVPHPHLPVPGEKPDVPAALPGERP